MKNQVLLVLLFLPILLNCNSIAQETSAVKTGAQVLIENHIEELKDRKVGLVMNPTARIGTVHVLDTLLSLDVNITALFSPEHGFRGEFSDGEIIEDGVDQQSGLPVYSLYGSTKKPTPEMLANVDLLLFDMQDVGARFYTFNSTMRYVIEAASEQSIEVWVLDRPNPAGGEYVSGWVLDPKYESMVGSHYIPVAHGLTLGELALMGIGEEWYETNKVPKVRIIPMEGWLRDMRWPETGLTWFPPSPNLPTFEHAFVYLGTCFIEGTTVSEGRGTNDPFLTIGAPDYKPDLIQLSKLEEQYNVFIDTLTFTPRSIPGKSLHPKYENTEVMGISISIGNGFTNPVEFGVDITNHFLNKAASAEYREYINLLTGYEATLSGSLMRNWYADTESFKLKRKKYLLYQ